MDKYMVQPYSPKQLKHDGHMEEWFRYLSKSGALMVDNG